MYCKKCGKEIPINYKFCTSCGQVVTLLINDSTKNKKSLVSNNILLSHQKNGNSGKKSYIKKAKLKLLLGGCCVLAVIFVVLAIFIFIPRIQEKHHYQEEMNNNQVSNSDDSNVKTTYNLEEKVTDFGDAEYKEEQKYEEEYEDTLEEHKHQEIEENDIRDSEYILPQSDSTYLTKKDLRGFSAKDCKIARNELYARHGRLFDDKDLQNYFNSCSWYNGRIEPDDFDESKLFNDYEIANRDLIVQYEVKKGYR